MAHTATDFLIIGSGIAGLRAAIALAPAGRVLVLTKAAASESNTGYAQGGIAVAIGRDDSPGLHASDTIRAGDGLCDEDAVRVLVEEGPRYVRELIDWGVRFDLDGQGEPERGLEAAHSVRRVLHAGDATGREIGRALWACVLDLPTVHTINHALVIDLIVERGAVVGVRFFDSSGTPQEARAVNTLLATGGAGQVFRETTNPAVATGDGMALGYRAGARVAADLEFVQFHPTALSVPGAPRFLISEALRGEGASLVNASGDAFMQRYHPAGDLAPRDVVARSIVRESERTGAPVCLTLAHLNPSHVRQRFPTIRDVCRRLGIDIATDPIPVGPAAHYMMGGVDTDVWGRTSIRGLHAAGEVACTGVHGANRLASNSLLEGLVFGARAAAAMLEPPGVAPLKDNRRVLPDLSRDIVSLGGNGSSLLDAQAVRRLMWESAGLFRSREGLENAVRQLDAALAAASKRIDGSGSNADDWRSLNLTSVARLVARAALRRQESRGAHYRADFPERDDTHWKYHVVDVPDPID